MHIPIFPSHKRFLRFCIKGKCYQFTCLCFGPSIAPRVFTKVISVVAAHLRMRNIRLAVYLDDWLFVNLIRRLLLIDREKALNLLSKLGFMINLEKSALEPSQSVVFIGAYFLLDKGIVCPTQERVTKIKEACLNLSSGLPSSVRPHGFLHRASSQCSALHETNNCICFSFGGQQQCICKWKFLSTNS